MRMRCRHGSGVRMRLTGNCPCNLVLKSRDRKIGFETMDNGSHDVLLSCFRDMPGLAVAADTMLRRVNQPGLRKWLPERQHHLAEVRVRGGLGDHEMEQTALAPARVVERDDPGAVGSGQLGHPPRGGGILLERESGVVVTLSEGPEHEGRAGEPGLRIGKRRLDRVILGGARGGPSARALTVHNCTTCALVRGTPDRIV